MSTVKALVIYIAVIVTVMLMLFVYQYTRYGKL